MRQPSAAVSHAAAAGQANILSPVAVDIASLQEQPCMSRRIYPYLWHVSCQPGFPRSQPAQVGLTVKHWGREEEGDLSLSSTTSAGFQEPWH